MNDLAPMKNCPGGGGCKVGQISSRGITKMIRTSGMAYFQIKISLKQPDKMQSNFIIIAVENRLHLFSVWSGRIRTLVSMATDSSYRLTL